MATGYLQVRVFDSRATLPLRDSSVAITNIEDTGSECLDAFVTTNENGLTNNIPIEVPDDLPIDRPFITVNLRISHPLFYDTIVNDVQIFANIVSLEETFMTQYKANSDRTFIERFYVLPQNLQFKEGD